MITENDGKVNVKVQKYVCSDKQSAYVNRFDLLDLCIISIDMSDATFTPPSATHVQATTTSERSICCH